MYGEKEGNGKQKNKNFLIRKFQIRHGKAFKFYWIGTLYSTPPAFAADRINEGTYYKTKKTSYKNKFQVPNHVSSH